jgi:carbamoyl-phosphate synthase small subunit
MKPAYLILETGHSFKGYSPEWQSQSFPGEIVFNTSMVGYPDALTDPSYRGQILTFSYPLIGNYGVPDQAQWESNKIQAAGMVCAHWNNNTQHHQATQSLLQWLEQQKTPMITGIDTRALIKVIRTKGVVAGVISSSDKPPKKFIDINSQNLVADVSCKQVTEAGEGDKTIIVVDCGIKQNILRHFESLAVKIKRVPYDYDYSDEDFDGVFISNGPGDPSMCLKTADVLKRAMQKNKPTFGICLGSQIMALAIGAKTYKLPFGHRAQNHPCMDMSNQKCYLTSQNHGFAIDEKSLPKEWQVSFKNLNDNTVQGIHHKDKPFFSVQFHPEAAPGPVDTAWLFDKFYELL